MLLRLFASGRNFKTGDRRLQLVTTIPDEPDRFPLPPFGFEFHRARLACCLAHSAVYTVALPITAFFVLAGAVATDLCRLSLVAALYHSMCSVLCWRRIHEGPALHALAPIWVRAAVRGGYRPFPCCSSSLLLGIAAALGASGRSTTSSAGAAPTSAAGCTPSGRRAGSNSRPAC